MIKLCQEAGLFGCAFEITFGIGCAVLALLFILALFR